MSFSAEGHCLFLVSLVKVTMCMVEEFLLSEDKHSANVFRPLQKQYTCQLFFSKMWDVSFPQSEDLPTASKDCRTFRKISDDFRRLPTIAKDFPTTSEGVEGRCRKISDDFKSRRANDFQRISNQSRSLLNSSEDVLTTSRTFFKHLHSLLLVGDEKLV